MDLSDIGISLRIYDSESEGDSEFSVLPAVGGPFAMPPGYEPKSPIYMMNESNKKIKKNITVTMGHCANLESEKDCKKMIFLKGCADPVKEGSRLIYKFEVVAGANGKFAKGDRQGEITLQEAVPLCIANKQSKSRKKSLTTAYFLKLYSTPSPCDNYCAILAVSIYQDLYVKLLSSFMRKKYPALTESAFKPLIHFDEDQIKIKWNTGKAWTVISDIDPPMIRQEEVDLPNSIEGHGITFEDGEIYPPRIKLIFTPEEPHVQSNCKITVLGLTEDISLNLSMTPETPRSSLYEKKVEPGHREAYLRELSSLLDPAAFKWESIGIALDFSTGDLHNIKHNYTLAPEGPRAFLRVLIQQWLGWTPPDHNFPTLESLYNALKTPNVDEQVLAEKLLQKIMTEKLMQRNPDIKTRVNDSIGKLVTTTLQWKGNEMITKTGEVVSWMNEIMKNLKEPSDLFSKAGMIKSHCEAISQLSQDVLQEAEAQSVNGAKDLKKYKECVITASQLLHKQAHLQLTYSQGERMEEKWVPAMESVINQIINLADALKKLLEQTDLVVRETPKSTKSNQWTIVRPLTRHGGYVETMRRKIPITGVFGAIAHPRGYSVSTKKNRLELPGVVFYQEPSIKGNITFNKEVNLKGTGIWLSIPKNSSSEEPLTIYIRTCFSGPFELPEDYEPASSAYLIKCSRKVVFQKSITVKIHHYVCLESEEDCDDMVFLSASSIPKYGKSGPRYSFREIEDARVSFRPGHQVGDIMLKHFCVIRAGKRKRKKSDSSRSKKHKGNTLYSARLYRNRSQKSVTFCICLYNKVYIEHCDSVIMKEDARRWELSAVPAQLTSDEITLSVIDGTGWIFDREPPEILKRSIHLPEEFEGISECSDYPPRLSLQYSPTELEPTDEHPNLTKLRVFGLDRELNFIIKVPHHESPAPTPVNIPSSPMVIPHRLSMDDLPRVVPFLEHMDNDQLIALGCQLGLSYCGLKRMETGDLLREMVAAWLRREDNVILLSGTPSWNSLVAALEKIHQNGIAFEIKAAHSFEQWQPTQMYSSTPP